MDWISYVLLIVFLLYFIGLFVWILWRRKIKLQQQKAELAQPLEEPTLVVTGATVVGKEIADDVSGSPRMPRRTQVFSVCFQTDDGNRRTLSVPKEVFDTLNEGDSGALALQNDGYYDFLKGETATQNQE